MKKSELREIIKECMLNEGYTDRLEHTLDDSMALLKKFGSHLRDVDDAVHSFTANHAALKQFDSEVADMEDMYHASIKSINNMRKLIKAQ